MTLVADTTTSTTTASEMTLIPDSKSHRQMAMSSVIDTNLPRISEKFAPSDSHGSKQLAATGGDSSAGISAVTVSGSSSSAQTATVESLAVSVTSAQQPQLAQEAKAEEITTGKHTMAVFGKLCPQTGSLIFTLVA